MAALFRSATPGDARAIVALYKEAGLHPDVERQHLEWKYWQPRADWPGPRSFVLTDGGEVIAHLAIVPGRCVWQMHSIRLGHLIDWAASPKAPGAGIALLNQVVGQEQAVLAVGASDEALQILPRIGFRAMGAVSNYVRPLRPLRLRRSAGTASSSWRLAARVVRSIAWTLTAPPARASNWQPLSLAAPDVSRISAVLPVPLEKTAVFERSAELFRYMLSCPILPMELFAVKRADQIQGYYLLASAPGQIRIADYWMDSQEPADWRELILCAVEQATHHHEAAEVVSWASDPTLAQTLEACGFRARYETPMLLRPAADQVLPQGTLRVQMLDTDLAYLHGGSKEFWS